MVERKSMVDDDPVDHFDHGSKTIVSNLSYDSKTKILSIKPLNSDEPVVGHLNDGLRLFCLSCEKRSGYWKCAGCTDAFLLLVFG